MIKKRYSIVRVDNKCPAYENINLCDEENTTCEDCKVMDNYGDTKEEMIKKIAQVLFKEELGWYKNHIGFIPKGKIDEPFFRNIYEHCLDRARKIISFLGVEE